MLASMNAWTDQFIDRLEELFSQRGVPAVPLSDDGAEFISQAVMTWTATDSMVIPPAWPYMVLWVCRFIQRQIA